MARSKKDISNVVSGAGLLTRILTDLDKQLRKQGGEDADWHRLTTPDGEVIIQRMVNAMLDRPMPDLATGQPWRVYTEDSSFVVYPITVDYGRSLAEMVTAGHYDYVNPNIISANFAIEGSGTVESEGVLVHLDRSASTEEVEAELAKRGLRPATIEELLAFGEAHPDIQREFPVVALGASWVYPDGGRHVAYLWSDTSSRRLDLYWIENDWHSRDRFLAVRK